MPLAIPLAAAALTAGVGFFVANAAVVSLISIGISASGTLHLPRSAAEPEGLDEAVRELVDEVLRFPLRLQQPMLRAALDALPAQYVLSYPHAGAGEVRAVGYAAEVRVRAEMARRRAHVAQDARDTRAVH